MKIKKRTTWYTILVLFGLFALLVMPYPKLFTMGDTECKFCIGDCWDEMERGCSELYRTEGIFWFLETYQIVYSFCEGRLCTMLITVYCNLQGDDFISLGQHHYTIDCQVSNCFVCNPL